jgi:hypothetical protein
LAATCLTMAAPSPVADPVTMITESLRFIVLLGVGF